ncbi:hypothetical protein [Paraglaciecola sp.]|uniref:hypothetical protein n=1 Tax=Paraglaciecola sp. TaxID=1920173 RepID=UPI003EF9E697
MTLTKIVLVLALTVSASNVNAAGSIQHSGKAIKHSTLAVGHGIASTAKTASAVVAVPLIVGGSVAVVAGTTSVKAGASLVDSTKSQHKHTHAPLVITETTITADPAPDQIIVIQTKQTPH